jgi:hypothetical protein
VARAVAGSQRAFGGDSRVRAARVAGTGAGRFRDPVCSDRKLRHDAMLRSGSVGLPAGDERERARCHPPALPCCPAVRCLRTAETHRRRPERSSATDYRARGRRAQEAEASTRRSRGQRHRRECRMPSLPAAGRTDRVPHRGRSDTGPGRAHNPKVAGSNPAPAIGARSWKQGLSLLGGRDLDRHLTVQFFVEPARSDGRMLGGKVASAYRRQGVTDRVQISPWALGIMAERR